ncbi:MAG TPA: ATPase, T2SS/T4P/T4SS family [Polyangiaceae bacterium]|nr:ATPase, T2SS/T4P/T4SS family [Polyangiaceae bacterium]
MFAIVVSEKGGAERRELFEKHEINVGRVQGNDLMLPKGNVSKRHARLLFRDGRFIVTDLKSTNGTYVNGRKIAQATIVREGDKIYVGDFVLRVELTSAEPSSKRDAGLLATATSPSGTMSNPPVQPARASVNFEGEFTARHEVLAAAPAPDSSSESTGRHPPREDAPAPSPPRAPAPFPGELSKEISSPSRSQAPSVPTLVPRAPSVLPSIPAIHADRLVTSRSMALSALIDRVSEAIDLAPLSRGADPDQVLAHRIERIIREKAKALRDEGLLPENIDVDDTIRDAQRELLGLGALEVFLDDDDVSEIRVFGHNHVSAVRGGEMIQVDPSFSSEASLHRVIGRLCRQASAPLASGETVVERYLPRGLLVNAALPPTSQYGNALVIRKRRRAEVGIDDLVRSGTISRAMAVFLRASIAARVNLLVIGPAEGTAMLLSAFASAGGPTDRVVALQTIDELWGLEPAPVSFRIPDAPEEAAKLVRAASKLRADRLIVSPMAGHISAAVASAITEGSEGVLACASAPSIRHALDRLVPDLMASRPGISADAAKTWIVGSFELAVEVARLRDGRYRVTRLAELASIDGSLTTRDIFTFIAERTAAGGAVEGSFVASGTVPRIAEELAAKGGAFDPALFKRERT